MKSKEHPHGERCRVCGCGQRSACRYIGRWGATNCYWAAPKLCSHPRCLKVAAVSRAIEILLACVAGAALWAAIYVWPLAVLSFACVGVAVYCLGWLAALLHWRFAGGAAPWRWNGWAVWTAALLIFAATAACFQLELTRLPAARTWASHTSFLLADPRPIPPGGRP